MSDGSIINGKPLPAHWARPHGLSEPRSYPDPSEPLSARRARQKAAKLAACYSYEDAAPAPEAPGLVSSETSHTKPDPVRDALRRVAALAEDPDAIEVTHQQARLNRLRKSVLLAANAHRDAAKHSGWSAAFFTLTTRPGVKVRPGDVSKCVNSLQMWARRKLKVRRLPVVWVAEMQPQRWNNGDKDAVHYHLLVWLPPSLKRRANALEKRGLKGSGVLPKLDAKRWWKWGKTNRDWVRRDPAAYIAKYVSKGGDYQFPKGLRLHGSGGFEPPVRAHLRFCRQPLWLREQLQHGEICDRAQGGGFISRLTGAFYPSPWRCVYWDGFKARFLKVTECNVNRIRQTLLGPQALELASC
ncbi:replication endonuclease [Sinimarinibacterium flocculans]|uniref:Replication-associated protein ORF2/G2P domain-containing protein n=1 Tax=Sinimarinibacterium flocculans TaxID=985250 RepID=A0A318E1J6_9GAMM|nr:replication endonuclease [Sinimarinibacterium flocculans]PXV63061.1 hypothetical protein C8D93_12110 [Sinimarinibacterium flocculans]